MSDQNKPKRASTMKDLLTNEYGVNVHPSNESGTYAVGTTAGQILSNNPNRVGLTFVNPGTINVLLFFGKNPTANFGILLAGGGGTLSLNWRDDMTMIPWDWYAIAPGGATNITVASLETL